MRLKRSNLRKSKSTNFYVLKLSNKIELLTT